MAEQGLWLAEEPGAGDKRPPVWRRLGVVAAAVAVLIVAAVPITLVATGSSPQPTAVHNRAKHPQLGHGPAEHAVLAALSATTDSGSFDFSYSLTGTPATSHAPSTTPTTVCHQVTVPAPNGSGSTGGGAAVPVPGSNSSGVTSGTPPTTTGATVTPTSGSVAQPVTPGTGSLPPGLHWQTQTVCNGPIVQPSPAVQGAGVINTNPLAMVTSANIGGGLDVSVRVNNSTVYEGASNDTGLTPMVGGTGTASGTDLPGFAGITEGTLGNREGAVAMMGMASPTGYLDLNQPAINAAAQTGTGTVDGVAVTNYQVTNDLSQLAGAAGTSSAESQTIAAALTLLQGQGYTSNTVVVSIDGAGFIRQVKTTDDFSDGGTVVLEASFSNFGCAGTVLMPGQTGSGVPPAGCTSPDQPNSSTTTTTVTPNLSTPPTTIGSTATTTVEPATTQTTTKSSSSTVPPSTGSTSTTRPPNTSTSSVP